MEQCQGREMEQCQGGSQTRVQERYCPLRGSRCCHRLTGHEQCTQLSRGRPQPMHRPSAPCWHFPSLLLARSAWLNSLRWSSVHYGVRPGFSRKLGCRRCQQQVPLETASPTHGASSPGRRAQRGTEDPRELSWRCHLPCAPVQVTQPLWTAGALPAGGPPHGISALYAQNTQKTPIIMLVKLLITAFNYCPLNQNPLLPLLGTNQACKAQATVKCGCVGTCASLASLVTAPQGRPHLPSMSSLWLPCSSVLPGQAQLPCTQLHAGRSQGGDGQNGRSTLPCAEDGFGCSSPWAKLGLPPAFLEVV